MKRKRLQYGDPIFFIHMNKVIESKVLGHKSIGPPENETYTYLCGKDLEGSRQLFIKVDEAEGYPTKEELLKSL